jgi:phage portal protein BeeE
MGLFTRATADSREPVVKAAAGSNVGMSQLDNFYAFTQGNTRQRAMSVPAITRARDLLASVIGCTPLKMYNEIWNPVDRELEQIEIAPRSWLRRLDPALPNSTLFAWLFDDLFFTQRAFLAITARTADGFPSAFQRMPSAMVLTQDQAGPVFFAPSKQIMFSGLPVDHRDVVQFISPIQGLLFTSPNAVLTSLKLENARLRSAAQSLPNGVLRQIGGEPLSAEELQQLSQSFEAARLTNTVAALNEFVTYTETTTDPSKQMLVEASEYQALEIARLANCPPYLLGVATGSYSYQNSTQARQDLYMFGAKLFMDCIAETLSADNVLPRGTYVKFDIEDYLSENYLMEKENDKYNTAETGVMPNA